MQCISIRYASLWDFAIECLAVSDVEYRVHVL